MTGKCSLEKTTSSCTQVLLLVKMGKCNPLESSLVMLPQTHVEMLLGCFCQPRVMVCKLRNLGNFELFMCQASLFSAVQARAYKQESEIILTQFHTCVVLVPSKSRWIQSGPISLWSKVQRLDRDLQCFYQTLVALRVFVP